MIYVEFGFLTARSVLGIRTFPEIVSATSNSSEIVSALRKRFKYCRGSEKVLRVFRSLPTSHL